MAMPSDAGDTGVSEAPAHIDLTVSQAVGATASDLAADRQWHDAATDAPPPPPSGAGAVGPPSSRHQALMDNMMGRFPVPDGMEDGTWRSILQHTISPRRWIADEARTVCGQCHCAFPEQSMMSAAIAGSGKHHCRICGDVFCETCALLREPIALPDFIQLISKPGSQSGSAAATMGGVAGVTAYLSSAASAWAGVRPEAEQHYRRCECCDRLCQALKGARGAAVQESLEWLKNHDVQNKLPYHPLTPEEHSHLAAMFRNPARRGIFRGHSKWLLQLLLRVVDWGQPAEASAAAALMLGAREPGSCRRYCCTRGCQPQLQPEDVVVLLANLGAEAGREVRGPLLQLLGESKRLVVESPWSQFTSECQRF
jgi:hypothetical protein